MSSRSVSWPPEPRNKYGVAPAAERTVDGITFASKAEARRYGELRMLEKAGEIRDLRLQPRFDLRIGAATNPASPLIAVYVADFSYYLKGGGQLTVEDVKGVRTPAYRLKKKLFEALYWIQITEVPASPRPRPARPSSRPARSAVARSRRRP